MKITKKTALNLLIFAFVLSFFVTPLGTYGKVWLNRIFATAPSIIAVENRGKIPNYDWRLKDANWNLINFRKSEGKVVFINFWASWHVPSEAQLHDIQDLYDAYKDQVDFYIITNEEKAPVEKFMSHNRKFTFPITYRITDEPSPVSILDPPGVYILDKNGYIVVHQTAISDWDNEKISQLLDTLIAEK
ncbi:MAG: redoxin domain-containing protein [Maribacter sp.]|nr:redoxin domain-containing protein [Maribacter sp.]